MERGDWKRLTESEGKMKLIGFISACMAIIIGLRYLFILYLYNVGEYDLKSLDAIGSLIAILFFVAMFYKIEKCH